MPSIPLPELSKITCCVPQNLRAFGMLLASLGLTKERVAPVVRLAKKLAPPLCRPIRTFHLRNMQSPAGYAMRMFMFQDPVTAAEARTALGKMVDPLLEIGLLVQLRDETIVSPFVMAIADDLFILSDDLSAGAGAVMGFSESTIALCSASFPGRRIGRVHDLGCGSGTGALVLSRCADFAVGTDINPRAIEISRVNAAINGITNVEFREGDLFVPVAGETFDLLVSQPPFIPRPDNVAEAVFAYGGSRGDEIVMQLLPEVAKHLTPSGKAVLFIEWPRDAGPRPQEIVRSKVGTKDVNVLVLEAPTIDADEHSAVYAAASRSSLDRAFDEEALLRRTHFERMGIAGMTPTLTILQRVASDTIPFTHVVEVDGFHRLAVTHDRIERLIAARSVAGDREKMLAACLRMPDGTALIQQQMGPGAEVPSTLAARFSPEALIRNIELTPRLLWLLTLVHEASTVREGIEGFATALESSFEEAEPPALEALSRALLDGVLEIAKSRGE